MVKCTIHSPPRQCLTRDHEMEAKQSGALLCGQARGVSKFPSKTTQGVDAGTVFGNPRELSLPGS